MQKQFFMSKLDTMNRVSFYTKERKFVFSIGKDNSGSFWDRLDFIDIKYLYINDIEYTKSYSTIVDNFNLESLKFSANEVLYDFRFEAEYIDDSNINKYNEDDICLSFFLKRKFVKGWTRLKETKEKTFEILDVKNISYDDESITIWF